VRYLSILLLGVIAGCGPVVRDGASSTQRASPSFLRRMIRAVGRAPDTMVDALLPAPPQAERGFAAARSSGGAAGPCLTPEQAYQLVLTRETADQPRYQQASSRDAIEVFGRAIGPIAAARYWARTAAVSCVTQDAAAGVTVTAQPSTKNLPSLP